ncbi:VRR-NUC domain-containing protein [Pseudomonas peradeniyensis]|uniref:VRR-NUC domain-containing protein n=1 Tax=Pseudomonas TaxID=286 RepID=UPI00138F72F1|nr:MULTISPECIES: VRR-NUC domain-containing protein [Pseudomonas]MCU7281097.1 VRR-NUC domain-containing protein [Pseudomonas peradeniyensis]QZA52781.1 VRR-NUC domain-containing protein [Pseudomonas sp. 2hn]
MYQRTVSQLIRADNISFRYKFPYCGEVGYNMTVSPPQPIMSEREPFRPSTFPISQYQQITNKLLGNFPTLKIETDLLSKPELESILSSIFPTKTEIFQPDSKKRLTGLVRIPDVVRLKSFQQPGKLQYSQKNLLSVIEMKFPGDTLSPAQQLAYQRIAGDPGNLRLLETKQCEIGDKKKWREWVRANVSEPVYRPVGQVMSLASRASAEKHKLLIGQIDAEHALAIRLLTSQPSASGPQLSATPKNVSSIENRRAMAGIELTLAAPFVAVGAAMMAIAATPVAAASEGSALVAHAGGQAVRIAPLLNISPKELITGILGAGAASPAFATANDLPASTTGNQTSTIQIEQWNTYQRHQSTTLQNYVIWENLPEKLHD